jgi:hypothetical protein
MLESGDYAGDHGVDSKRLIICLLCPSLSLLVLLTARTKLFSVFEVFFLGIVSHLYYYLLQRQRK